MLPLNTPSPPLDFLTDGGKMGDFIRRMDWSETPVGDPAAWPQSLRTSVSICLNSPFPLLIWWGTKLVKIYNDAFSVLIADRHPEAMGATGADVWPATLPNVLPMLQQVLKNGKGSGLEDQPRMINRGGRAELCYFSFSYSAIRDESGSVGGIFCAVTETTQKVVAERKFSDLLNNLFIQAPVAMCILRGEQYVVEVANREMLEIWGRSESDVINKPVFEAMPEVLDQGFEELLDTVYNKGERFVTEEHPITILRHGRTEHAFVKFIYEPLRDDDGNITGIMGVAQDITEQVNARNKIQDSNQRYYKILMDSSFAFSITKGKEMVITLANDLMKEIWGKGDKVEGWKLFDLLPELVDQSFPEIMDAVYTTGIPFTGNEILARLNRDGRMEDHYYNVVYQPHYEADESVSGVIKIVYEVTEMVMARKQLETRAGLVNHLLMTAPGFVCTFKGRDHVYDLVNDTYQRFFGNRQIKGKPIFEALPELEDTAFDKILDKVYTTGETYLGIDIPFLLARDVGLDPELYYFNFSCQPMYDVDGKIYSILFFGYNVTEQVVARKKMEASEFHFRQIADMMPAKVANVNSDGNITYCNKHWLDFTGMTFEEFRDFGYRRIVHPDEVEESQRRFRLATETGKDVEMEMRFLNSEGEYIWNLNRASPVKDANGNIEMWISVTSEIQKIKNEEQQKDNFLSMASHELKTPVTTIKAYGQIAEMMLQKNGDKETLAVVSRLGSQVDKLTTLIGELLDFTKIKGGKLAYNEEVFDFNEFMKEIIEDMRHTSSTHQLSYIQSPVAEIYGDQEKLSQVVVNLISNAIKYSPGANKVIVTTRLQKDGMILLVEDFGIGIPKADRDKVFEQFYRVTGSTQSTFPGMGIGLYICAEIVKRHGGRIWVESSNGKGSVFCLWLPFDHRNHTTGLNA